MTHTAHKKVTVQSRRPLPEHLPGCTGFDGMTGKAARFPAVGWALPGLAAVVLSIGLPLFSRLLPAVPSMPAPDPGALAPVLHAVGVVLLLVALLFSVRGRSLAAQAERAGLAPLSSPARRGVAARHPAPAGMVMLIGSTGRSFSSAGGELAESVFCCREARILLLDPREHGARACSQGIADGGITIEKIRQELADSITCLRGLRAEGRTVRLKLYPDAPLFKLVIRNGTASLKHYHPALNVGLMPEFVFRSTARHGGLYLSLERYFLSRWQDCGIPEYDFDADELVYHDQVGAEVLREPFGPAEGPRRQGYVFRSEDAAAEAKKAGRLIPSER